MTDLAKTIGANIAAERQRQNLSQHALGRRAGVPGQSISTWELGQREIGAARLIAVAHALNVSVPWLIGDSADTEKDQRMTEPGVLDRIATALETIANALTPHATRPNPQHTQFEWEPPQTPTTPLPEPAPPQERCGYLIEQYTHPLDRITPIYQITKSGHTLLLDQQEAARLAELGDEEFTAAMDARLAETLAQRRDARDAGNDAEEDGE